MGHVGPTLNKKILKKIKNKRDIRQRRGRERWNFFIFFSLASLFNIWKSDRRNLSGQEEKCSTRRGLRMRTKNIGFR